MQNSGIPGVGKFVSEFRHRSLPRVWFLPGPKQRPGVGIRRDMLLVLTPFIDPTTLQSEAGVDMSQFARLESQ